ncbi:MAG: aspartate aminotransferase family protein [Pelagibaca sp.]|nr:aspartate aminotransferase family protein [Pelagibaca sp.]
MNLHLSEDLPDSGALFARRQQALGPAYRHFYETPLHLVRAEGVWMVDVAERRYLDFYNNVPSVGHCHPAVIEAMTRQAARLNTHTRYLHDGVVAYAERLPETFPDPLSQVMFTCTGSEANDLALRICQSVTGGEGVIVVGRSYHGVTGDLAKISTSLGPATAPAPHVRVVEAPTPGGDVAARFEVGVRGALASLEAAGIRPAMLIFDTVFASQGLYTDPRGFVAGGIRAAQQAGALFVADEVQSGLARPGEAMWAFLRHDVAPDIVTCGKPLGNGHPLAAMVTRPDLLREFGEKTRYFNTFGGNPVSAAVGLAVLDVIRDEGLMENARVRGAQLLAGLSEVASRHDAAGAIRGAGLYGALEVLGTDGSPSPERAARLVELLREAGVLVGVCGERNECLKIRPLLPTQDQHLDQFLSALDASLARL